MNNLANAWEALGVPSAVPYVALIIDDHPICRSGLTLLLRSTLGDHVTVLEAGSLAEAELVLQEQQDVTMILLDLTLPDTDGLDGLYKLRDEFPEIPVVVVSAIEDNETVIDAYRAGVLGFIPKSSSPKIAQSALRLVAAGGLYLPSEAMGALTASNATPVRPRLHIVSKQSTWNDNERRSAGWVSKLSGRQLEVLRLMVQGEPNKEIARALGLSVGTVKNHVAVILRTLDASNRAKAVTIALTAGID